MPLPHIAAQAQELQDLRRLYETATPRQRYKVALDRINNPDHYPNELVTKVSAVEAFARSLVVHLRSKTREEIPKTYSRYAKREATGLVLEYLKDKGTTPHDAVGEELWETFRLAVSARNLLVHECTYIDAKAFLPMAHACTKVLLLLREMSGTSKPRGAA